MSPNREFSGDLPSYQSEGPGCAPGFLLPPLAVLIIGAILGVLAINHRDVAAYESATKSGLPHLSKVFTPEVQHWSTSIVRWAATSALDPNLVGVVMQIESCGDPSAISPAGAIGLFQVMPYHFSTSEDPLSPDTNAARGLAYLARALEAAGGNARLALAGYNGGIGILSRPESSWPAETTRYAYWGGGLYADTISGSSDSVVLAQWLEAGGASLCSGARDKLNISG